MGSVVVAAPEFNSFHLHDRLQRELRQRGHSVAFLFADGPTARFWRQQELTAHVLPTCQPDAMRAPLAEFAEIDARRRQLQPGTANCRRFLARQTAQLARALPACVRWLEAQRPDLLLLHGQRCGQRALLHFVARELGIRVLWLGNGLLPHTLQRDVCGIDGDAALRRRRAGDYRDVPADRAFLAACLAHVLGRAEPAALSRRELRPPNLRDRLALCWAGARGHWRQASAAPLRGHEPPFALPENAFLSVLLQNQDDEQVLLDAANAPDALQLVASARTAARSLDPDLQVAVVLPSRGLHHRVLLQLADQDGVHLLPPSAAADAAAAGVATCTINHPLAVVALLAGSPLLHSGKALFELGGVTHRGPSAAFVDLLRPALREDAATLRERFLTVLLGQEHLWTSASQPDHNGLVGLAREVELGLSVRSPRGAQIAYRSGPPWPLAAPL